MEQIWAQLIVDPLAQTLGWLQALTGSYGLAIMLLAIGFKLLLLPLIYQQQRSSQKLQALQPQLQKLRQQYRNDPAKLNRETMALYQRAGVNPAGGCLWSSLLLIINLTVWAGIYQIMRGLQAEQTTFLWLPDLALPNGWPLPSPRLAYLILPALLLVVHFVTQRLALSSPARRSLPTGQVGIFGASWLFGLAAALLPAGLALFWLTGSLFDLVYYALPVRSLSSKQAVALLVSLILLAPAVGAGLWVFLSLKSIWVGLYIGLALLSVIFLYLGSLISGPYKPQQALYYAWPQLSLYGALWLAYRQWGSSPLTLLAAALGAGLFMLLYTQLMQRLAPQLTLKARLAYAHYLGQKERGRTLRQQLRATLLSQAQKKLHWAQQRQESSPAAARRSYQQAIQLLSGQANKNVAERQSLAEAHFGLGQIYAAAKKETEAIQQYQKARQLGLERAVVGLAPLLARQRKRNKDAVEIYLAYLQTRQKATPTAQDQKVLALLEQVCRIKDGDRGQKLNRAISRNQAVLQSRPQTAWAHYYLGVGFWLKEQPEQALSYLERARELEPDRAATHYYLGRLYLQTAQLKAARPAFEEALRLNPKLAEAAFQLGRLLLEPLLQETPPVLAGQQQAQLNLALRWLKRAVSLNQKFDRYYYYLGRAYLLQPAYPQAVETLARAIDLNSREAPYHYYQAVAYHQLNEPAKTKAGLQQALSLDKDHAQAHHLLADLFFEAESFEEAALHYWEVLRLDTHNTSVRRRLGRSLYELADYEQAITELSPIAAQFQDALFYLARSQAKSGQFEAAVATLQKLLASFGPQAPALYYLGCAYANAGLAGRLYSFERALSAFSQCLEFDPGYWQAYQQMGHIYLHQGQIEPARQHYLQAQTFQPENVAVLCALGQAAYLSGQLEQARAVLEQALQHAPAHAPAHLLLGAIYQQQGDRSRALEAYRQAGAYQRLGILYCQAGDYARGQAALRQAQEADNQSDTLLNYLGFALARNGQYKAALEVWERLLARHPDDSSLALNVGRLHYLLGCEQVRAGRYAEGAQAWEKYLQQQPDDEPVRRDLAELFGRMGQVALQNQANRKLARWAFERAFELARDKATYDYYLALSELAERAFQPAHDRLQRLLQKEPDHLGYAYHLGLALLNLDRSEEARDHLERVRNTGQGELVQKAHWLLAGLHARQGAWPAAADLLTESI